MDFLNHREGGMVSYQVFLCSLFQCTVRTRETVRGCVSLKEGIEISRQNGRGD
jgi:hypothetical protein